MSWSISSSKSLLFLRSDNIVQGPRCLVIQSSFADQFVLISLQEIEHEKKKENGDLFFSLSYSMYFAAFAISSKNERDGYWPGIEGKMAMTCEEKIAKPKVLQKCDVMGFGGLEIASEVQAVTDSLCAHYSYFLVFLERKIKQICWLASIV